MSVVLQSEYRETPCLYCSQQRLRPVQRGDWGSSKRHKLSTNDEDQISHATLTYDTDSFDYYICDHCWRISMCGKGENIP